jgi:hypothetical protein
MQAGVFPKACARAAGARAGAAAAARLPVRPRRRRNGGALGRIA